MATMQVETFECSETAAEPIEATEEAVRIIEELGLAGQMELVTKRPDNRDQRCPYREMLEEEVFVYGVLCPQRRSLADYKASPIPLRVLQLAAHATSLGLFNRLEVWDRANAEEKDPVLVAHTHKEYESGNKRFLLARWGEVLEPLAVLMKRAVESRRAALMEDARDLVKKIENATRDDLIRNRNFAFYWTTR